MKTPRQERFNEKHFRIYELEKDFVKALKSKDERKNEIPKIASGFPKEDGFKSAAVGLAYIQSCYNTSIDDIVLGKLWPVTPHSLKTFSDLYQISKAASLIGRLDLQIDWFFYLQANFNLSEFQYKKLEEEKAELM